MNCGLKPSIFIFLSILLQGCSPSPALSQEARHVKADIESLRGSMAAAGNSTWKKGEGIARRINSLPIRYMCPIFATTSGMSAQLGSVVYNPQTRYFNNDGTIILFGGPEFGVPSTMGISGGL